jgi:hypothetical protein
MKTVLRLRAAGVQGSLVPSLHKQRQMPLQSRCAPAREYNCAAESYVKKRYGPVPEWVSREAVARAAVKATRPRNVLGKELPSLCC